jgi:hypothetical protein
LDNETKGIFDTMNMSNFSFPANGYYNPMPPKRPTITTQNYQNVVSYADKKEYGGNGDGKVTQSELDSIKKVFDYASDYYKNMYQNTGDTKYQSWSDYYGKDAKASTNIKNNFSIFQQSDPTVTDGITAKGITTLAGKDGNAGHISLRDVAMTLAPNFDDGMTSTTINAWYRSGLGFIPAWDGADFATTATNRATAVDANKDKNISYQEALNSPDGLLGNGLLKLSGDTPEMRTFWDAISGPDGTVNPQELAAMMLSSDADTNGTITAQEADNFMKATIAKGANNPRGVVNQYNNMQDTAEGFGLNKFLAPTAERQQALDFEATLTRQQDMAFQQGSQQLYQTQVAPYLGAIDPRFFQGQGNGAGGYYMQPIQMDNGGQYPLPYGQALPGSPPGTNGAGIDPRLLQQQGYFQAPPTGYNVPMQTPFPAPYQQQQQSPFAAFGPASFVPMNQFQPQYYQYQQGMNGQ